MKKKTSHGSNLFSRHKTARCERIQAILLEESEYFAPHNKNRLPIGGRIPSCPALLVRSVLRRGRRGHRFGQFSFSIESEHQELRL
jgi:hypothetical protein